MLHFVNVLTSTISSFTANNQVPYRDVLIVTNGVQQRYLIMQSTNITVNVNLNDSLMVIVRAVGNVSVLNVSSDRRFTCATSFACNSETQDVANRQLLCSLRSPVELSDDGRMLLVRLLNHSVELTRIVIKCKYW